jgi:hypothetical protein
MKKYYILCICVIAILFSCSDSFLERNPKGRLDESGYLKTDDAAFKLVTSCYQPLNNGFSYSINRVAIGSESVDDADGGGSDAGDRPQTTELGKGYPLSSNPLLQEAWSHRYRGIGRCNEGIGQLSKEDLPLTSGGQPVSKEIVSRYISEMKFLRAWYYFDLVNTFGGVPLLISIQLPDTRLEKATLEEMRTQLYKDLDDAINDPNLPWKKGMNLTSELGRVSKDAVYTFKGRIALFFAGLMEQNKMQGNAQEEYEIAKNAASAVITQGGLSLTPDFQDLYGGDYDKGLTSAECLFTCLSKYVATTGYSTDTYAIMNVGRNNVGGWGGNVPTTDLANSYNDRDPRKLFTIICDGDIFKRAGGEEVHNYKGYYNFSLQQSRKAFVPYDYRENGNLERSKWAPYWIRYAETLLIYAEAVLKTTGNKEEVTRYINMVRHRAYVTTSKKDSFALERKFEETLVNIDEPTFLSEYAIQASDNLEQAIKNERRAEFALEGLRLYDLIRWGDYVSTMRAFSSKYQYAGKGSEASDKSWPFPIPQTEIDRSNGVLTQNENYK